MRLLYGFDREVADFVAAHLVDPFADGSAVRSIGVLDGEGRLVAGVCYFNWDPAAGVIEMSAASVTARWLTRPVLKAIFAYPFEGAGCQMVVLRVSDRNTRMGRICRAFGFSETRIPRLRGRQEDEIIFTLTDDAWRANGFHRG